MDAYVNHAFNTSVENVFLEFKRGFFKVCDRNLVKLFRPKELQEMLVGKDFIDWERLKQVHSKQELLVFSATTTTLSYCHVRDLNTRKLL